MGGNEEKMYAALIVAVFTFLLLVFTFLVFINLVFTDTRLIITETQCTVADTCFFVAFSYSHTTIGHAISDATRMGSVT